MKIYFLTPEIFPFSNTSFLSMFSKFVPINLQKNNHDIKYKDMTSGLNIIWKKNQLWHGIADPRREGFAIGY